MAKKKGNKSVARPVRGQARKIRSEGKARTPAGAALSDAKAVGIRSEGKSSRQRISGLAGSSAMAIRSEG